MVAIIKSWTSLTDIVMYNENKVDKGKASLINMNGYAKDKELSTVKDRLLRLTDLASRNIAVKTNAVHISLNFDIGEKLDVSTFCDIADHYMEGIGFADQPYLVYQHKDAGHPHLHIVTTNIQPDGKRISLNDLGKTKSAATRRAIEIEYNLVKAEGKSKSNKAANSYQLKPLEYGEAETKKTISNILEKVLTSYKFTSLPELNAVLNTLNIEADRGSADSTMFKMNGLRYWALDKTGKRIGVPIKASSIGDDAILRSIESCYSLNDYLRKPFRDPLKRSVDLAAKSSSTIKEFKERMARYHISVHCRVNDAGRLYGVTYVDHHHKTVFKGSDLGKGYGANDLAALLATDRSGLSLDTVSNIPQYGSAGNDRMNILEILTAAEFQNGLTQAEIEWKKRHKKKRRLNL